MVAQAVRLLEPRILGAQLRRGTPIATVLAHVAYGAIVVGFASLAG
jgi:hypothetical protein